jgi:hypothetical protein
MAYLEETLKTFSDSTNEKFDAFALLFYIDKMGVEVERENVIAEHGFV